MQLSVLGITLSVLDVMLRSERFVSLMALLQENESVTAKRLAKQLGVSERTIYRDIDALSESGVPIQRRSGAGGGVSLPAKYRESLQHILDSTLQVPDKATSVNGKQNKTALLEQLVIKSEQIKPRVYVDTRGWFQFDNDLTVLPQLQVAVQEALITHIKLKNKTFTIHPYGLVVRGSVWYLIAEQADTMQVFRVSHIKTASLTQQKFARADDFNVAEFWQLSTDAVKTRIKHYPVQVRIQQQVLSFFEHYFDGRFTIIDRTPDGRFATISVMFHTMMEAKAALLGLGPTIKVITPMELHDEIMRTANAIVDFHGLGPHRPVGL